MANDNPKLDKTSKIIFTILAVLVVISISLTYYRSFISRDFETFYDDYEESAELDSEENNLSSTDNLINEETDQTDSAQLTETE